MEKSWSEIANNFDEIQEYVTGKEVDRKIKAELADLKGLGQVLELACGNGNYTRTLAKEAEKILATDISEDMISCAKKKLEDLENIDFMKADCYETGLDSSTYDTVFMANIIHVVHKPDVAIEEAKRLMKDEGRLVILSFTPDGLSVIAKMKLISRYLKAMGKPPKGGTKFTLKTLKAFVLEHGFEVEEAKLISTKMASAIFLVARK